MNSYRQGRPVGGEKGLVLAEQCLYLRQSFHEEAGRGGARTYERLRLPFMERRFLELGGLAAIQLLAVDFERGKELAYDALRDIARVFRRNPRLVLSWQEEIYDLMSDLGRSDAAIPIAEARLAFAEKIFGKEPLICASTRTDIGRFYYTTYRFTEAISMLESALRIEEQAYGPDSGISYWTCQELGNAYRAVGRLTEALELHKRAVGGLAKAAEADTDGDVRRLTYLAQRELAITYRDSGQLKAAATLLTRTIRKCRQADGPDSLTALMCSCDLAMTFYGANSSAKAVAVLERSLPRLEKALGPDRLVRYQGDLATAYMKCDRPGDAASLLDRTITALNHSLGAKHGAVQAMRKRLEELRRDEALN
jgi:tetratricopeptide (TPR) repeat protein